MKKSLIIIFTYILISCNNSEDISVTEGPAQKTESVQDRLLLLPQEKSLQDAIKNQKIMAAYCFKKELNEKDTFRLHEIRTYDENGRLYKSHLVNSTNTDTSVTKTFVYNGNGVLMQTNIKTPNNSEINEFFIYKSDGQLTMSYQVSNLSVSFVDTFQFSRVGDTLFKYITHNGNPVLDNPDLQIFNKKGQIIKEIQCYPMATPIEVVTKLYKKGFPLPIKEIYSKSIVHPMEYKIDYKFK
jgi:hypothetical protein